MMRPRGITLIVPIAHDLAYDDHGTVICGPGTREACDHALAIAQETQDRQLFVSACEAPAYRNVVMAQVMMEYLLHHEGGAPIAFRKAPYFSTLGQVLAVAHYLCGQCVLEGPDAIYGVVFAVKSWHAECVRALSEVVFEHYELTVRRTINPYQAQGKWYEELLEPWKTSEQIRYFRRVHIKKEVA